MRHHREASTSGDAPASTTDDEEVPRVSDRLVIAKLNDRSTRPAPARARPAAGGERLAPAA